MKSEAVVMASEIAVFLKAGLNGKDLHVTGVCSASKPQPGCMLFIKSFDPGLANRLGEPADLLILAPPEYENVLSASHIIVPKPRLAFALTATHFFSEKPKPGISPSVIVHPTARISPDVRIGHYSVIGAHVLIGEGTEIRNHVTIADRTVIGRRCLVKSCAVIGEEGFGFDFLPSGEPVRIPHFGRVVIGEDVEIGAFCTIARGTIDDTVIGDHVKIDDHVHIAHNVSIGRNTLVIACAEVSGSVSIGSNAWIGPNSSINNGLSVLDRSLVGIGSVVTRSVPEAAHVLGNPAREIPSKVS